MYDESFWSKRRVGVHRIAGGMWKSRFRLRVSFFRARVLCRVSIQGRQSDTESSCLRTH